MIPVTWSKLEICWWSWFLGVSVLQISSVGWDISVVLRLSFHLCSLDDFYSKSQNNQIVWVSSKAVYNFVGSVEFNWTLLPHELSHLCFPVPSFPLHMISRCPVLSVKPWQLCKYISYVRYSLYVRECTKFYWNWSLWAKIAINILVLKHKLQSDTAM